MAKDINIHIKTRGAEQTRQQLQGVGKSAEKVGDSANQGGRTGAEGIDKMSDAAAKGPSRFARLSSSIKSWVFGLVGISAVIAGITRAIQAQKQAMEEHARIAAEQQKKLLALMGMGTFFEEHPQARKRIAQMAEFGRRPFEEVAEAWYNLESKGAGLTKQQKEGILHEALELGRMEPEADLKSIIDVFSLYAKETRQQDINQIQNVLRQTLSQAGAELSQIGQYLPRFLSLGIAGGLSGAETAGLWAYATTRAPSPEMATVGIRNIFSALRGEGTPEAQKILEQVGVTKEQTIFEQLSKLSEAQKAGRFGVPEAEKIAGKENIAVLLSMLTEPKAMMETVRSVTGVARPDIDIVKSKLDQIMSKDEIARIEEEGRRLDVIIANIKGEDIEALKKVVVLKEYELRLREADVAEYRIQLALAFERILEGFGVEIPASWRTTGPIGGPSVEFPKKESLGIVPEEKGEIKPAEKPEAEIEGQNVHVPVAADLDRQQAQVPVTEDEKLFMQKFVEGLKNIFYPFDRPASQQPPANAPPTAEEVPVEPVAKEAAVEVPIKAGVEQQQVEVPVEPTAKDTEVEVPVEPVAKETEVEVPVKPTAKETEVEVPVEPVAKETAVEVPAVAVAPPVEVPVDAEAEQQQVEIPVEAAAEQQHVRVPVEAESEPVAAAVPSLQAPAEEKVINQTVNNFNYQYDHSLRYYPRVGSDESGPRIEPGVQV